jgi:hypothetical protein
MQSGSDRAARGPLERRVVHSAKRRRRDFFAIGLARSFAHGPMIAPQHNVIEQSRAGTHVTRVSAIRLLPVRADLFALQNAKFVTDQVTPPRRRVPAPLITSG